MKLAQSYRVANLLFATETYYFIAVAIRTSVNELSCISVLEVRHDYKRGFVRYMCSEKLFKTKGQNGLKMMKWK